MRREPHRVFHHDPVTHHVYVVHLDPAVWKVSPFKKQNKGREPPFNAYLYVGQTSKSPEDRFKTHKSKRNGNPTLSQARKSFIRMD